MMIGSGASYRAYREYQVDSLRQMSIPVWYIHGSRLSGSKYPYHENFGYLRKEVSLWFGLFTYRDPLAL